MIRNSIGYSSDVVFREFRIANSDWKAALVYVDGLVDTTKLHDQVMKPLIQEHVVNKILVESEKSSLRLKDWIMESVITLTEIKQTHLLSLKCKLKVLDASLKKQI